MQSDIDDVLGKIPQPEKIALFCYVTENKVEFPEDLILNKEKFAEFIDHSIKHQNSLGYHVISVELKYTINYGFNSSYLYCKVAKLPETIKMIIPLP